MVRRDGGFGLGGRRRCSLHTLIVVTLLATLLSVVGASTAGAQTVTVYRVNAGGPQIDATPNWIADNPSPYVNTGNNAYSTTATIDTTHASIPAGTPASLFQSERWDPAGGNEMQWNFPVTNGTYQVDLYFAEIVDFFGPGDRVFDVTIDGTTVSRQLRHRRRRRHQHRHRPHLHHQRRRRQHHHRLRTRHRKPLHQSHPNHHDHRTPTLDLVGVGGFGDLR